MTAALRPMTAADLDVVLELEAELFGRGSWTRGMFEGELGARWRHYRVAEADGQILGYAGVLLGQSAHVMTIGVNPQARRRGIGRMLLADLIDAAKAAGAQEILLEVRTDAEAPQALYRSFGFTPLGVRKNYYQAEGLDALVMHKHLTRRIGPVGSEVTT